LFNKRKEFIVINIRYLQTNLLAWPCRSERVKKRRCSRMFRYPENYLLLLLPLLLLVLLLLLIIIMREFRITVILLQENWNPLCNDPYTLYIPPFYCAWKCCLHYVYCSVSFCSLSGTHYLYCILFMFQTCIII
jgi:hypothetical protein